MLLLVLAGACSSQGKPKNVEERPERSAEERTSPGTRAGRLEGSPYPVSSVPDTLFVVADAGFTEGQRLTVETLQGMLAKEKPEIYRREEGSGYEIWLNDLVERYGVVADYSFEGDYEGLLRHFKNEIDGYILCDPQSNSGNVAISLSGIFDVIAVAPGDEALMAELGIPKRLDVRRRDERWAYETYGSSFSKDIWILL